MIKNKYILYLSCKNPSTLGQSPIHRIIDRLKKYEEIHFLLKNNLFYF